MSDLTVRLTPWARNRIAATYGGINKTAIRNSIRDFPGTEFHTVATVGQPREGAVVTVEEAARLGVTHIEVRFNDDRGLAIIEVKADGQWVLR